MEGSTLYKGMNCTRDEDQVRGQVVARGSALCRHVYQRPETRVQTTSRSIKSVCRSCFRTNPLHSSLLAASRLSSRLEALRVQLACPGGLAGHLHRGAACRLDLLPCRLAERLRLDRQRERHVAIAQHLQASGSMLDMVGRWASIISTGCNGRLCHRCCHVSGMQLAKRRTLSGEQAGHQFVRGVSLSPQWAIALGKNVNSYYHLLPAKLVCPLSYA